MENLRLLRAYHTREDIAVYETVMGEIFKLFGEGIHESLARTMGNYLEATNGALGNKHKSAWQIEVAARLLCTNNAAESPFATVRAFLHMYSSGIIRGNDQWDTPQHRYCVHA